VLRLGGTMPDRVNELTRLNRTQGVGQIMVTHSIRDLAPGRDSEIEGIEERAGAIVVGGVPKKELAALDMPSRSATRSTCRPGAHTLSPTAEGRAQKGHLRTSCRRAEPARPAGPATDPGRPAGGGSPWRCCRAVHDDRRDAAGGGRTDVYSAVVLGLLSATLGEDDRVVVGRHDEDGFLRSCAAPWWRGTRFGQVTGGVTAWV
jgi:hypothetical protein